jgi:hypothetical protein
VRIILASECGYHRTTTKREKKTQPRPKRKKEKGNPKNSTWRMPAQETNEEIRNEKSAEQNRPTMQSRHQISKEEKKEKRNFRDPSHWNGIQAKPIELSKGLEYCAAAAAEELMAVVVAAIGVESISRHFCSQWREGQRSETPCSSIYCGNRQQKENKLDLISSSEGRKKMTYLRTNDIPLALLVILASGPQRQQVLLLPHAEALAQALVLHLQGGDVPDLVLVVFEAGRDVFPGQGLGFFEVDQKAVVFGEGFWDRGGGGGRGGGRGRAAAFVAACWARVGAEGGCC